MSIMKSEKTKQVKSAKGEAQEHREALSNQMLAEQEEKLGALEAADDAVAAQVGVLRRAREDVLAVLSLGKNRDATVAALSLGKNRDAALAGIARKINCSGMQTH
ncbi:MAG: hypothetical protein OQL11_07675 [Gammaproteobacteria bacterium]|nr:hypothetical protein [Gammaproteobacteria bacterium]